MNKLLPFLLAAIVLSCQPSSSGAEGAGNEEITIDSLKRVVLAIHDEVMPKMGELRRTRKDLMLLADSIANIDSLKAADLTSLADEIGAVNEGMMQWMRGYEPEFEGTEEEVKVYLEAQRKSIQKVKEEMEGSLAKGLSEMSPD